MIRKLLFAASMALLISCSAPSAFAQEPAPEPTPQTVGADTPLSQTFRITVPKNITITCPDTLVETVHDETDADQTFPVVQTWEVKGNTAKGVTVTFSLDAPFSIGGSLLDHQRRDASLAIAPGTTQGPAEWNGVAGTISTDIANDKFSDTWQSESDGVGRSTFDLTMTFVNALNGDGFGGYEEGIYETTVTGEVTENP